MQNTLAIVMTIKSPEDYRALVALLPQAKDEIDKSFSIVKTVHFARILLLDSNKVAIITEFDGDFDAYVQDFSSALGLFFAFFARHRVVCTQGQLASLPFSWLAQKHTFAPQPELEGTWTFFLKNAGCSGAAPKLHATFTVACSQ